jgi:heme/copper-type cytochrome/quinol oxidase subunit 2
LCGMGHYRMRALVRVVSEDEFQNWIKVQEAAASGQATSP